MNDVDRLERATKACMKVAREWLNNEPPFPGCGEADDDPRQFDGARKRMEHATRREKESVAAQAIAAGMKVVVRGH